LLVDIVS